jgi:hypothetical protein
MTRIHRRRRPPGASPAGVPPRWRLDRWLVIPVILVLAWGAQLPGWTEPKRYDPDSETCQINVIRQAYRANLVPWEDQPAAVQQRLRQLQAAMTLDTLRNCQSRGLLSPVQVSALAKELQLPAAAPAADPAAPPADPVKPSSPTRP